MFTVEVSITFKLISFINSNDFSIIMMMSFFISSSQLQFHIFTYFAELNYSPQRLLKVRLPISKQRDVEKTFNGIRNKRYNKLQIYKCCLD